MTRYAQNGGLTRFDEGKSHQQNALGGVPIGGNNSVEENETKQNNFIYSDRIFLDSNTISQYNLPKSLIGKSVADATKFIDNKFKGRNDKISQSTKDSMLSKIAEAQESMKPQEPEMEQQDFSENIDNPNQMAWGGEMDSLGLPIGQITAGATGLYDMGNEAFGKSDVDISGSQMLDGANATKSAGAGALKGASTGAAIGSVIPGVGTLIGAGAGAILGGVSGFIGGKKDEKAQNLNNTRFMAGQFNKKYGEQYALGGEIDPPIKVTKKELLNTAIIPNTNSSTQLDRFRYAVGEQGGVQHGSLGEAGHYLYYGKKPGEPGFNPNVNREFVNQNGYDTYMRSPQGQQYRRNLQTQSTQPVEQFAMGGKMNQMYDGGDYYENLKLNARNQDPNGLETFLKPATATTPYTIGTQPIVDISNANRIATPGPSNLDILKYSAGKVGDYINKNAGNLARYAPIAANAYQLSQLKKPQGEKLSRLDNRYKPNYADMAQQQNIVNQELNNTNSAIQQSGASQGAVRNAMLASQLNKTKALSNAYMNAQQQNAAQDDRAQVFNLGIDQTNLQQSNIEKENDTRNIGNYDTQKSRLIGQLGNDVGNVGKEEVYKKIAKNSLGYTWDGKYWNKPDGTKSTDEEVKKEIDSTKTNQKKLGSFLIKNK